MNSSRDISPFERYGQATPFSESFLAEHIFVAGETLSGLAAKYYRDWRLWRVIADRNGIVDARRVTPGTRLLIPPRPLADGRYEAR
jgi:nucleoid-associated protein YgaU